MGVSRDKLQGPVVSAAASAVGTSNAVIVPDRRPEPSAVESTNSTWNEGFEYRAASAAAIGSNGTHSMGVVSADRTECIMRLTNSVVRKVSPWSEEKTLYNYTSVRVNELKRSDIPRRLVTDCSGFVSWVIRQGCGQKGRDVYDKLWAKSAKKPETWRGRNKQPRIRAIGFYNAFTRDGGGRWSSPQALTDARHGDMLVYTIDKSIHKCKSLNGRPVKDSGHIMIIVGIPFRDAYPGNTGRCSGLTRYKFKVWTRRRPCTTRGGMTLTAACDASGKRRPGKRRTSTNCPVAVSVQAGSTLGRTPMAPLRPSDCARRPTTPETTSVPRALPREISSATATRSVD